LLKKVSNPSSKVDLAVNRTQISQLLLITIKVRQNVTKFPLDYCFEGIIKSKNQEK